MISRTILVVFLAAFTLASCAKKESGAASANATADSMKAAYVAMTAAWDGGKASDLEKYVSADFVLRNAMPGTKGNLEDMKKMAAMVSTAYPDMKSTVEDMRVDGDVITARIRMQGTNTGPDMGMPATNKKIDVMAMSMYRWKNGKFVEGWFTMEEMKMMTQLGMMPEMGASNAAKDAAKPDAKKK
jgi:predicted ester cyclase